MVRSGGGSDGLGEREAEAVWRLGIIGSLLASPPAHGDLAAALRALAVREWRHPVDGRAVRLSVPTLERWYYAARDADDPMRALRRSPRRAAGVRKAMSAALAQALPEQHRTYPDWTVRLHYDNLRARARRDPTLGPPPSYSSVLRWMREQGLRRAPRRRRPGAARRAEPPQEMRLYESSHVHGLWHGDYHHGSLLLPAPDGSWRPPKLLSFLDDRSRFVAHAQWFFEETARCFVHGLIQAVLKCGLPRALLDDNGPAMRSAEVVGGLRRLGVLAEWTRPYSPEQNGECERLWLRIEEEVIAQLEGVEDLTLDMLNQYTLA